VRGEKKIVREILEELNGLAYGAPSKWLEKDMLFLEDRYQRILARFPEVARGEVGLEVGLHHGIVAFLLKRKFRLKKLYALEHPTTCKRFTKKYLAKLEKERIILRACDLHSENLPWPKNFFDFIVFSEIMEHLIPADLPFVIREIRRVLKKGGKLLVTTPNIASLLKRVNLLFGKNPNEFDLRMHFDTYGHIREYTMGEVVNVLQEGGFRIVEKGYLTIDSKRNIFTYLEYLFAKIFPPFSTNLWVLAKKA